MLEQFIKWLLLLYSPKRQLTLAAVELAAISFRDAVNASERTLIQRLADCIRTAARETLDAWTSRLHDRLRKTAEGRRLADSRNFSQAFPAQAKLLGKIYERCTQEALRWIGDLKALEVALVITKISVAAVTDGGGHAAQVEPLIKELLEVSEGRFRDLHTFVARTAELVNTDSDEASDQIIEERDLQHSETRWSTAEKALLELRRLFKLNVSP